VYDSHGYLIPMVELTYGNFERWLASSGPDPMREDHVAQLALHDGPCPKEGRKIDPKSADRNPVGMIHAR
jgi:hypothetical protein